MQSRNLGKGDTAAAQAVVGLGCRMRDSAHCPEAPRVPQIAVDSGGRAPASNLGRNRRQRHEQFDGGRPIAAFCGNGGARPAARSRGSAVQLRTRQAIQLRPRAILS